MQGIELDALMQMSDIDDLATTAEIEALKAEALLIGAKAQAERDALEGVLRLLTEEKEAELAYGRDVQSLEDRRVELVSKIVKLAGFEFRLLQAQMATLQREGDYLQAVQRAQLLDAKLTSLNAQRDNINLIVGSPSAVFSSAACARPTARPPVCRRPAAKPAICR